MSAFDYLRCVKVINGLLVKSAAHQFEMIRKLKIRIEFTSIPATINRTQQLLPAHQFNIILCLTMCTIYIPNAFHNKRNQQCSDEQLFSFFITYQVIFSERTL